MLDGALALEGQYLSWPYWPAYLACQATVGYERSARGYKACSFIAEAIEDWSQRLQTCLGFILWRARECLPMTKADSCRVHTIGLLARVLGMQGVGLVIIM